MSEISNIIKYTFSLCSNKLNFFGDVYLEEEGQLLSYDEKRIIGRNAYNKLLIETNAAFEEEENLIEAENNLLLAFVFSFSDDQSNFWESKNLNFYESLLIVEEGIINSSTIENESNGKTDYQQAIILWEDIDLVELMYSDDEECFFRFYYKNETHHSDIYTGEFCTDDLETCRILNDLFNEIVDYKKQISFASINEHNESKTKIIDLIENNNFKEALNTLDDFRNTYEVEDISYENTIFYYINRTLSLINLEEFEEALKVIDRYIEKYPDNDEAPPYSYELKGEILMKTNNFLPAINYLAKSEENYEEAKYKKDAFILKEESYSKLKQVFSDISYNQRKLIFIGEDIHSTKSNEIVILKKNDLPLNIKFPIGHPHLNEIYTCHPHKQNLYLPLKDYSEELFLDRINEFSYLLQCLGAKSLEISSSKSNSSDQKATSSTEVDAKIDYKINSAHVNYKGENTENTLIDGKLKISKKQVFKPVKAPFVPTNLIWYHSDLNWQRLVDQRLNGNIMAHNEIISSSQSENISSHELKQIDAELKLLLPKIGVTYNGENEIATSSKNTHEWILTVEFEDVENLQPNKNIESKLLIDENNNNKEIDTNLKKYREDVLVMIEDDGIIDDMERNILNRKIKRYGISEEDALIIENEILTTGYAENELNYIQEIKEFLEDGGISNIERKILDRYALKFGVDKDKQIEIDKIFIN
ncbi:tetratricopeptide repeat protein [Salegentibacter mishustinae]|uniref:Uncharacterized protein n=1 Tax=Salegentibacter mishustinae TaxID=270918 RepID=A0A0Q9ZHL8_9FLAO|nr:hypothetical protein [Salegentibacter mishustinae]KRG28247.1 hypothetical protein APR42_05525 [Salegentibacter mishustinae]PNW22182.1 hypothetical protein APB85_13290 [Salegentibacter mishustinae]PZX67400.1 hypothetical protein LY54_00130 [Salegentibacter mishustinae]GGW80017.1 hypothetical protein GCM10008086_04750 [Salegentibacter mishustinae]